jgi:hypothetical protein
MPTDNERKANLDELTVLSKCLMGTPMPGNEDLAAQFRTAISTVLGKLGHAAAVVQPFSKPPLSQPTIRGLRGFMEHLSHPSVMDDFIAQFVYQQNSCKDDLCLNDTAWLETAKGKLLHEISTLRNVDDKDYEVWVTIAAIALVSANAAVP